MVLVVRVEATAAAYLLRAELGRLGAALIAVAAVGVMGVGIFPEDYGAPHGISALVTFLFGGIAVMIMGARRGGVYMPLGIAMGVTALAALALFVPRVQTPLGIGGVERLIAYPILIFFILYGLSDKKAG